jgi:hypothetical protein
MNRIRAFNDKTQSNATDIVIKEEIKHEEEIH